VQQDLSALYSLDFYWKKRQKLRGVPPIERRAELYRSDGRLDAWLRLIEEYGPSTGSVVEVGCAPGVLLESLTQRGYECVGVEISDTVARWMRDTLGLDARGGFFPGIDLPRCDLFLSFDTLEHSPCPDEFVREAARLLVPGGVAIIQTAVERYNYDRPFGERFIDMFDDLEHLFLFTDEAMRRLAADARLEVVNLDERIWLGGEVVVFRKPTSAGQT
jgi:SAM-dependent methyltransferase